MEADAPRLQNIARRVLMWIAFFTILYLLRDFFSVMFLTFIMGFVMRKVAQFLNATTRLPHWAAVLVPYIVAVTLLSLLMATAIPRVLKDGSEFSRRAPNDLRKLAEKARDTADHYGLEPLLAKWASPPSAPGKKGSKAHAASTPAETRLDSESDEESLVDDAPVPPAKVSTETLVRKAQDVLMAFLPEPASNVSGKSKLEDAVMRGLLGVFGGTLKFLLAILLSFLIVLDYDRIAHELETWRKSTVGHFFSEAASSVVEFSGAVGTAFQCQLLVTLLNSTITCVGLVVLDIQPVLLLTTIVFLFGLIPVLGVWISSVPIVMIAFNDHDVYHALSAIALIAVVHLLEAYVFNPRIYAARFHLNPVIVLIILLVGHELFGIWGMLLGIPITHYVLNIAQVPPLPRKQRKKGQPEPSA